MDIIKNNWKSFSVAFLYTSLGLMPAYADDTEIYFGGSSIASEGTVNPNILFILDTSGSMKWDFTQNSGSDYERLNALKSSMTSILNSVNNVNIGLMRFTNPGGPVLHKVQDISATAGSASVTVSRQIASSLDDGEETVFGGVVNLANETLEIADKVTSVTDAVITVNNVSDDIAEETKEGNGYRYQGQMIKQSGTAHTSIDIELMTDTGAGSADQYVGVRFSSLNIPISAVVESASLEFTVRNIASQNSTDDLTVDVRGQDVDSGVFASTDYNISTRSQTASVVPWQITSSPSVNNVLASNDISSVVQEMLENRGASTDALTFILDENVDSQGGRRELYKDSGGSYRPTLKLSYGAGTSNQSLGLRFTGVDIPSQVTVTNAYIEFTAARSNDEAANYTVSAENIGNAPAFTTTANDIRSRTKSPTQVAWNGVETWVDGNAYRTPDLSATVQELVNHTDWCGGNAMAFMVDGASTGRRVPHSFDGNSGLAPKLVIEYDASSIPAGGGCANEERSYQINGNNNDAEQKGTSGNDKKANTEGNVLNLDDENKYVGVRFKGIDIPNSATITSAYLELTADSDGSDPLTVTIKSQQTDDASRFRHDNNDNVTSDRTWSSSPVNWAISNWNEDSVYQSPDVASLVQEVVNRSGWASGNDMAFQLGYSSGAGARGAVSYNQSAINSPRLVVHYQVQTAATALTTVRDELIRLVSDEIIASGSTPIVETMHEAALYFKGESALYGKNRSSSSSYDNNTRVSASDSWAGGTLVREAGCDDSDLNSEACKTEYISGSAVYTTPMTESCQENHIVLLTDGDPTDGNESISAIETMIGQSCDGTVGTNSKCGEELAQYLYETDLFEGAGQLSGTQNVTTHTISLIGGGSSWLSNIASVGGGGYYSITGSSETQVVSDLTAAFNSIIGGVLDVDTSFVAPAVAINQFNRLTHREEIYYAVFRPQSTPKWPGNLKKYGLSGSDVTIVDANSNAAVDPDTGAFYDTSKSIWSSAIDGNNVAEGGMASNLPDPDNRKLYTYHGNSSSTTLTASDNLIADVNSELTKAMLGISGESDSYRSNLISWIRGVDVSDEDGDGDSTDFRYAIGDPLHSRPLVVTYDSDPNNDGNPVDAEYYLFFGTNEGVLHVVDGRTGVEKFGMVPDELLSNFDIFYQNQDGVTRPYGLDGESTVWVNDVDADGKIEPADGDHVYLYIGMRRGGRNYYAYDLTDLSAPKFLWEVVGGSGDFDELGQAWSKPLLTKIKYKDGGSSVTKQVLVFGGGYDTTQDSATVRTSDGQGRGVYIVDAETGAFLWGAGEGLTETHVDMDYSIPARLAGSDVNGDGVLDLLFFGDMGGQVWRVDFDSTGTEALAQFGSLQKVGDFSAASDSANTRRFYHGADIALVRQSGSKLLYVLIGSGYRAHPLNQTVTDRFYAIKQPIAMPNSIDNTLGYLNLSESSLYDATENLIQDGTDAEIASATTALNGAYGWYVTMENTGEKVLSRPLVVEGKVVFTTYEPTASLVGCIPVPGKSREYILSVLDASAVVEINNVDGLTKADRSGTLNLQGIVDDTVVVVTDDGTGAFQGTQKSGLELDTDRAIRTFWYQE